MIQHCVSAGNAGEEVGVGRIMDWVEARLDAVKAREEEEDEEEEKEKERDPSTAANGGGRTSGGKTKVVKAEPTASSLQSFIR
jgi:protein involved in temperature-dependent protein secretion